MNSQDYQSDLPGDSPAEDNTDQSRAGVITPNSSNQYTSAAGYTNPSHLTKGLPSLAPRPSDDPQSQGHAPWRATSSTLHDSPQPGTTTGSNQGPQDMTSHALPVPSVAPGSSASLESAPGYTRAIAARTHPSLRSSATMRVYPGAKTYGCVLNRADFTVKFVDVGLPDELAVRFLLRTKFGDPHMYAIPNGFIDVILTGLASQMTDYWPPGTD